MKPPSISIPVEMYVIPENVQRQSCRPSSVVFDTFASFAFLFVLRQRCGALRTMLAIIYISEYFCILSSFNISWRANTEWASNFVTKFNSCTQYPFCQIITDFCKVKSLHCFTKIALISLLSGYFWHIVSLLQWTHIYKHLCITKLEKIASQSKVIALSKFTAEIQDARIYPTRETCICGFQIVSWQKLPLRVC